MQIIDAHKREIRSVKLFLYTDTIRKGPNMKFMGIDMGEIHSGNTFLNTDIIRKGTYIKFIGPDLKEMHSDK